LGESGEDYFKEGEMKKWEWFLAVAGVLLMTPLFYLGRIPLEQPHQIRDLFLGFTLIYSGFILLPICIYRVYLDWRYGTMRESEAEEEGLGREKTKGG